MSRFPIVVTLGLKSKLEMMGEASDSGDEFGSASDSSGPSVD